MNRPSPIGVLVSTAFLLLAVGVGPPTSYAQMATDRPGFADGSFTLGAGTAQAELGYAFNDNTRNSHELGQLLLRFGATNALELRGYVGSYVVTESAIDNGYAGTSVGAKLRFFRNNVSSLSGIAMVSLPTETGVFDTVDDRARQELKIAFDGALGEEMLLSVNAGSRFFYEAGAQDDRAVEWLFTPTLSMSITDMVGVYVGYAGFYSDAANRNWVESGLTLLQGPDTQLDINTGLEVGNGNGFFVGAGLVHRL